MDTWVKYYRQYIVVLSLELLVLVLAKLPDKLKAASTCSGNSACGWTLTMIMLLSIPIPVLWIYSLTAKRLHPIVQGLEQKNKIRKQQPLTLVHSQMTRDGIIYLDLCNRLVKSSINVSRVEIANKARWIAHREEFFPLVREQCKEIQFIKLNRIHKYFSIVDDIRGADFEQFEQGIHYFDVSVTHGNGSMQWFRVMVYYKEPDQITLEINDD